MRTLLRNKKYGTRIALESGENFMRELMQVKRSPLEVVKLRCEIDDRLRAANGEEQVWSVMVCWR